MTVDLIAQMATKWLMGGECKQHWYFEQRHESRPGGGGGGEAESDVWEHYSEWHMFKS